MKKNYFTFLLVGIVGVFSCQTCMSKLKQDLVDENFVFARKQLKYALTVVEPLRGGDRNLTSPRSQKPNGKLIMVPSRDWCSGFFPGELWMMYGYTGEAFWKEKAEQYTQALAEEQLNGSTHDMGFKMYCSYGLGYKYTKNASYRETLIQSAKTLITRFNPQVGCLCSWSWGKDMWSFPVIIDNLMNLELLFWASRETGDTIYKEIAIQHVLTTQKNHFRDDYSSFHVVDYNPLTGAVNDKKTHQGFADNSAWARGQAWGLYGYTMAYRETGKKEFLEQAEKIASYIFNNPNMPEDLIPYWDFNAPGIPREPRDVSAAAVLASALYELSGYSAKQMEYIRKADQILEVLSSSVYQAEIGSNGGFLLKHSTGSKPHSSEVDAPLVYADYYFLEALMRKKNLNAI